MRRIFRLLKISIWFVKHALSTDTKYVPLSTMELLKNTMFNIIYDCDNLNQIIVTVNWLSGFSGILGR